MTSTNQFEKLLLKHTSRLSQLEERSRRRISRNQSSLKSSRTEWLLSSQGKNLLQIEANCLWQLKREWRASLPIRSFKAMHLSRMLKAQFLKVLPMRTFSKENKRERLRSWKERNLNLKRSLLKKRSLKLMLKWKTATHLRNERAMREPVETLTEIPTLLQKSKTCF